MAIVENFRLPLVLFAAIGSALSAVIFLAFSTFVMQALDALWMPWSLLVHYRLCLAAARWFRLVCTSVRRAWVNCSTVPVLSLRKSAT